MTCRPPYVSPSGTLSLIIAIAATMLLGDFFWTPIAAASPSAGRAPALRAGGASQWPPFGGMGHGATKARSHETQDCGRE